MSILRPRKKILVIKSNLSVIQEIDKEVTDKSLNFDLLLFEEENHQNKTNILKDITVR